jgi:hypothetical protein
MLEAAVRTRLLGKGPPRPQTIHLEGGDRDGVHLEVLTTDRTIRLGDRFGPTYWRTHRMDEAHGCGLTVFVPAPLLPGQMPPDPLPGDILRRMTGMPKQVPHEGD